MGFKDHGYYGYAFIGARPLQIVSLITVIGMVGNFISADTHAHVAVPDQLVGTLVASCLALLWTLLSATAYDDSHFPYIATSSLDTLFMIPFIVIAAILGGPLSSTTCSALPAATAKTAAVGFLALPVSAGKFIVLVGDNQTTCYEVMAVWGLLIALCVLFALSGFSTGLLFLGKRRALAALAGHSESQIEMAPGPGKAISDNGSIRSFTNDDATYQPPLQTYSPSFATDFVPVPPVPAAAAGSGRRPPAPRSAPTYPRSILRSSE